ncbi:MAG TPA: hypothetical protein VLC09_10570 [Polyangiaceae bacterium]|nr:hypothetical protein [Polyangiaceae bacterium]
MRTPKPSLRTLLGTTGLLSLFAACSGPGNTGKSEIPDSLAEQIPWVNGRPPVYDDNGEPIIPDGPQYPDIRNGLPDMDPVPDADCTIYDQLTGDIEFSRSFWFETFEPGAPGYPGNPRGVGATIGVAEAFASHDDKTEGSFRTPGELNAYRELVPMKGSASWGMPASQVQGAPTCDGNANGWAFHFRGGRFNRFGAGVEHPLALLDPCPNSEVCPDPDPAERLRKAGFPTGPDPDDDTVPYNLPEIHNFWDISGWDGISFWARRGPEGQGALTTILQDKHTSNDQNKQNETYCRRMKSCWSECLNRQPCTINPDEPDGTTVFRCFDPEQGSLASIGPGAAGQARDTSLLDLIAPRCGESACTSPNTYLDPDFDGKSCRPFTFDSHESGDFCFDEGDPEPADTGARCGDGYAKEVTITPYWKFYMIPFTELRQQGFGKVSPHMDLTTISAVAFIAHQGWVDFYIDNVGFYRTKR